MAVKSFRGRASIVVAMRHYPIAQPTRSRTLLRVRNAQRTVRAGTNATSVCVRTLDGVSATVRAGELIILLGGVASGAPSLAAFMAGLRHGMHGHREIAGGVRVRRGSISFAAFRALRTAWESRIQTATHATAGAIEFAPPSHAPVVYVFRVRDETTPSPSPLSAARASVSYEGWSEWARLVRASGGSVVVQCNAHQRKHRERTSPAVYEHPTHSRQRANSSRVRVLTLADGRVVTNA